MYVLFVCLFACKIQRQSVTWQCTQTAGKEPVFIGVAVAVGRHQHKVWLTNAAGIRNDFVNLRTRNLRSAPVAKWKFQIPKYNVSTDCTTFLDIEFRVGLCSR